MLWLASGFAGLLFGCVALGVALSAHAIALPSVLARTDLFWVGDLCRATQSAAIQYVQPCAPGYTVDLVVYGRPMRHYTLFYLPP